MLESERLVDWTIGDVGCITDLLNSRISWLPAEEESFASAVSEALDEVEGGLETLSVRFVMETLLPKKLCSSICDFCRFRRFFRFTPFAGWTSDNEYQQLSLYVCLSVDTYYM